jgi:hypothetical protein
MRAEFTDARVGLRHRGVLKRIRDCTGQSRNSFPYGRGSDCAGETQLRTVPRMVGPGAVASRLPARAGDGADRAWAQIAGLATWRKSGSVLKQAKAGKQRLCVKDRPR